MGLLGDEDAAYLRDSFQQMRIDVTVTVVTRERSRLIVPGADAPQPGDASKELKQIIGEVAATSPRIKVVELDAAAEVARAMALAGERAPAIIFSSATSKGKLRYYGLPAGYEMSTLVAALLDLGSGETMVPPEVAADLAQLRKPVHIQVFVTPSCPHCPAMARAALQLAMASEQVTADVVEVQEFPELASQYQIRGVPMTVVNESDTLLGNVGAAQLLQAVRTAGAAS